MVRIARYSAVCKAQWDDFVDASRNGTFLFRRAYMDYHSDRFCDHSLMFLDDRDALVALLPANECGPVLHSHQGLTYGGFVLPPKAHASMVEELFRVTADYLRGQGFVEWVYKQVPHIYHRIPSGEDSYFLWRMGAVMSVCNLSSTVMLDGGDAVRAEYCRRNAVSRLTRQGVRLNMSARMEDFWPLLEGNLCSKYNASPVHTLTEMQRLALAFPDKIRCCTAEDGDGRILAGVVVYDMGVVVHTQYSSASEEGQRCGAQDFLYLSLITHYRQRPGTRWFDLGTSNEDGGKVLNATLNRYKEGFGARGVVYQCWKIQL